MLKRKYSYFISYGYSTKFCHGIGNIEITSIRKLHYDDLDETRNLILNTIKSDGSVPKIEINSIVIINIILLKKYWSSDKND